MTNETSRLHQETGKAWDATARLYEEAVAADIKFLRAGGNSLLAPERRVLSDLETWCDRAIHLQCAGGKDTLSLLAQGAKEVVGIDISERMIASAKTKSDSLAAKAAWYCCDILDVPQSLDATADLVYTGRGALPWMMDLQAWADVVHRLLKPGGKIFVFEGHPLDWVWDTNASDIRFHPRRNNYFDEKMEGGERWPAPFLARQADIELSHVPIHERQWTLGQVINSLLGVGLQLRHFDEYPAPFWGHFPNIPEEILFRLPHTFSILAEKVCEHEWPNAAASASRGP